MAFANRCGEEDAQAHRRGQGRDRLWRRPTRDGIEHPDRDLLQACRRRVRKRAARGHSCCAPDRLVEPDCPPGPRMRSVDDDTVVASGVTMGLVLRGCTTPSAPSRRSDIVRQPRRYSCRPSSPGRPRSPDRLRPPSYLWWSDLPRTNFASGLPRGADQPAEPRDGQCPLLRTRHLKRAAAVRCVSARMNLGDTSMHKPWRRNINCDRRSVRQGTASDLLRAGCTSCRSEASAPGMPSSASHSRWVPRTDRTGLVRSPQHGDIAARRRLFPDRRIGLSRHRRPRESERSTGDRRLSPFSD